MDRAKKRSIRDSTQFITSPQVAPLYDRRIITDIDNIRWEKVPPTAPLSHLNSIIKFDISPSPNALTCLQDTLLLATWSLKEVLPSGEVKNIPQASIEVLYDSDNLETGEIKFKDDTNMVCVEPGSPLIAFQNVLVSIGDCPLPPASNNLNHYSAYMSFLFDSTPEARNTTLKEYSLFAVKDAGQHEATDPRPSTTNKSLSFIYSKVKDSKTVETISPMAGTPLSGFNRAFPPNTSISVTLDRLRPTLYVLSNLKSNNRFFEIVFDSIHLLVKRIELPSPSLSAYMSRMARSPIHFQYRHNRMVPHEIPMNTVSIDIPIGQGSDELPSLLRFGFVRRKAFLGSYDECAFKFLTTDLRNIRIKESDSTISSELSFYSLAEKTSSDLDSLTFLATTGPLTYAHFMKHGYQIDKNQFNAGFALMKIDLSKAKVFDENYEDPDLISSPRTDKISLTFEWSQKTKMNYTLVMMEVYDKSIHLFKDGKVALE